MDRMQVILNKELFSGTKLYLECYCCRSKTNGNIVNWNQAEWSTQNMIERNISSHHICKTEDKQHILIQGSRTTHAQKLLCNTLNGTMSAPENIQEIQKLIDIIEKRRANTMVERFLIGWTDETNEGTFVNVDTGAKLDDSSMEVWNPGEKNGGTLENCVIVKTSTGRMHDFPCDVQYPGFCLMDRRPRIKVRGG